MELWRWLRMWNEVLEKRQWWWHLARFLSEVSIHTHIFHMSRVSTSVYSAMNVNVYNENRLRCLNKWFITGGFIGWNFIKYNRVEMIVNVIKRKSLWTLKKVLKTELQNRARNFQFIESLVHFLIAMQSFAKRSREKSDTLFIIGTNHLIISSLSLLSLLKNQQEP